MSSLRRRLGVMAGAWLLSQALTLAAASVTARSLSTQSARDEVCTCAHGAGVECPMHHRVTKSASSTACRSATDLATAGIGALLGSIALTPDATEMKNPPVHVDRLVPAADSVLDAFPVPDAPPPRA
jgi:hypothetical protein